MTRNENVYSFASKLEELLAKKIEVCDLNTVGRNLTKPDAYIQYSHVLSIGDPESQEPAHLYHPERKVLRLEFADINRFVSKYMGNETESPDLPQKVQVEQAIAFLREFLAAPSTGALLIHCFAGISRSTAMALIACYLLHGDEAKARKQLYTIRPQAIPNSW
ncbi:MAG: hypothetical protein AAF518_21565, partial [Spirochaetota bacterium]